MLLEWIFTPLLGGIIGYLTNDLAIKMLFHPHQSIYIGKFHIPFTPGLIAAQKGRIAGALGKVISQQLLDSDTIRQQALSEKAMAHVQQAVANVVSQVMNEQRSLRQWLRERVAQEKLESGVAGVRASIKEVLFEYLQTAGLGSVIAASAVDEFYALLGMTKGRTASMFSGVMQPLEEKLASTIDKKLTQKGPEWIEAGLDKAEDALMDQPICQLFSGQKNRADQLVAFAMQLYRTALDEYLDDILRAVKIDRLVENKIMSFDAAELEKLIFGVMKKELNAIVYIGALLGFLMGFLNLLY